MATKMPTISIPALVRIKAAALDKLGIYCQRYDFNRITIVVSSDLPDQIRQQAVAALQSAQIEAAWLDCNNASFELAQQLFIDLPGQTRAVVGIGGGKALDVAKYLAFLARLPYVAVPTSLSNDGFCSPGSSLTIKGQRRSLPAVIPFGVIIDTSICLAAPEPLWLSGVGDLVAKLTAVRDWKLAFHATGEQVHDFAALLSDATVHQFISRPVRDEAGAKLLGTSLMLNGIAMEMCGSSRPASGSEHLVSHALDKIGSRPVLHGIQVGMATWLISHLQGRFYTDSITRLFESCGFFRLIQQNPFSRQDWLEAFRIAPSMKNNFHTVLSEQDYLPQIKELMDNCEVVSDCFT